jgi:hypothetical protein
MSKLIIILTFIAAFVAIFMGVFIFLVCDAFYEGYNFSNTPMLTQTIIVSEVIRGDDFTHAGLIATDGNGYILLFPGLSDIKPGHKYVVEYFCGSNDNVRKIVSVHEKLPESTSVSNAIPDAFKCRTVNGVCI